MEVHRPEDFADQEEEMLNRVWMAFVVVGMLLGAACGKGRPVKCGPVTCANGQECCNESCGICTDPGGLCTMQVCSAADGGTDGGT
jgi:hypothetical protein